jgi:hypothetical protein
MSDATMLLDALAELEEAIGHALSLGATWEELEKFLQQVMAENVSI